MVSEQKSHDELFHSSSTEEQMLYTYKVFTP